MKPILMTIWGLFFWRNFFLIFFVCSDTLSVNEVTDEWLEDMTEDVDDELLDDDDLVSLFKASTTFGETKLKLNFYSTQHFA